MPSNRTSIQVEQAIKAMKNNKAPGTDGYRAEFYKVYVELLAEPLSALFNYILAREEFPPSWTLASVVVIPKTGRDERDPKSYRPISLLNSDYKVFTAVLTRRLNAIMGSMFTQIKQGSYPTGTLWTISIGL